MQPGPRHLKLPITVGRIILVKHALPVLVPGLPARDWRLSTEGEDDATRVGAALQAFRPCRLLTSPEPKARETAAIVAGVLEVTMDTVDGLREIDRPILPIMSPEEHERHNRRLFVEFDRRVLGSESAREARDRFARALLDKVNETEAENLIAISHGTVIALFVSDYNEEVDSFDLWRRLKCGSFVVLRNPSMEVLEIVDPANGLRRIDNPGIRGADRK